MQAFPHVRLLAAATAAGLGMGGPALAQQAPLQLDPIQVIGITPTHGAGIDRDRVPANVQTATGADLRDSQAPDLTTFMNRRLGSVHLNEAQNNPLQPDLQYRGFTASPLLGLPQGLSVYQNGVRINEPFGDTVNWALIPESAIASLNLIPGSNPLFGLNTLGGALSLRTRTGRTDPGTSGKVSYGSFERLQAQAQSGGTLGEFDYFVTGEYFDEDGWRDFSPSEAFSGFGSFGWQDARNSLRLNLTGADTDLIGNGAVPEQLLEQDRDAIFTRPDQTENSLFMANLEASRQLADGLVLDSNAYFRRSNIDTLNGDDSDFEACEEPANAGLLCEEEEGEEEEVVEDAGGDPVGASDAVEGGTVNTSQTQQRAFGGSLQLSLERALLGRPNRLVLGGSVDAAEVEFDSRTELASLDRTRRAVGSGILDGESFVGVDTENRNYSLYLLDILTLAEGLDLTLAGRYNRTRIELDDQLGTALDGDHTFSRFNPSAGLTYRVSPLLTVFGSYSESNRAPTPVELTCADPEDPCRLPNAFLADPPLDDVVARTGEVGLRGRWQGIEWSLAAFNTVNDDDIIFISAGTLASEGFFDNVGDTRRRGLELNLSGALGPVDWFLAYTRLEAEFRDALRIASANHPEADANNEIRVERGDRLPGVPENLFKAGASVEALPGLRIGGELVHNSDQVLRGDESNQLDPVDGYTVVNLRGEYEINRHLAVFASVENLFDTEYETFGLLGEADEVLGDDFDSPRFLSPGAPRGGWVGLRASF